jgi:hypothetical protein
VGIIDIVEIPKMSNVLGVVAENAKNAECGNNVGRPSNLFLSVVGKIPTVGGQKCDN